MLRLYKPSALTPFQESKLIAKLKSTFNLEVSSFEAETCFCLEPNQEISLEDEEKLAWLLVDSSTLKKSSSIESENSPTSLTLQIGPRLSFTTSWCSNALSIFTSADDIFEQLKQVFYDRMTQQIYDLENPLTTFDSDSTKEDLKVIDVLGEGKSALRKASLELGLGFDPWDIDFYLRLFKEKLERNPTDVELFDLANSNSEHSRHWFFNAKLVDKNQQLLSDKTLFKLVKSTLNPEDESSVLAFEDNSSAIKGFNVKLLQPTSSGKFEEAETLVHGVLTCETHNFPCGISPFPGAETGTGGRIRDVQATGRGAMVVAGTAAYCVGNLDWDGVYSYPEEMAKPLQILLEASDGASDYGNKFGEPVLLGYTRGFGAKVFGERREWIKPIMMSAGLGLLRDEHLKKKEPVERMVVAKIGGPAFRIGMGGGAASSTAVSQDAGGEVGEAKPEVQLNFDAVQRGDAEMENKMDRVIKHCISLGEKNPILSIHDQGAGGNGNVLKEIAYPLGAELDLSKLPIGDVSMSSKELWGAEYQENNAVLLENSPEGTELFAAICKRERCPYGFLGEVNDTKRVVVKDKSSTGQEVTCVDLVLDDVLGKIPQKTFVLESIPRTSVPKSSWSEKLSNVSVTSMIQKVFNLVSVGSKRFLTNKVDRSVSGLIVQQQCVGPLQTPLADYCIVAQSFFGKTGIVSSVGEQPIKGLYSSEKMARLAVAEALTNLSFGNFHSLSKVKVSANWMWPAKQPGEGYELFKACQSMVDYMTNLEVAVDGGKDSLSMAVKNDMEVVKAPGQLAISAYAMTPDFNTRVTPDIKLDGEPKLFYLDLGRDEIVDSENSRLAGSALCQAFDLFDCFDDKDCPDACSAVYFGKAMRFMQDSLYMDYICAGHDVSDGGLLTCILEMIFSAGGDVGVQLKLNTLKEMFGEAPGIVIQPSKDKLTDLLSLAERHDIAITAVAYITKNGMVKCSSDNHNLKFEVATSVVRQWWEKRSFELDKLQANKVLVEQEFEALEYPSWFEFDWDDNVTDLLEIPTRRLNVNKPRVAVIREEGSNGDREMVAAFYTVGFEVVDIVMTDFSSRITTLNSFQGIAFVGGFSFSDVLGSAKGWAAGIKFNPKIKAIFEEFYNRTDTFSLGVCNGCQLMALLNIVPSGKPFTEPEVTLAHNTSGRFESRFVQVKVQETNSIMLKSLQGANLGVWVAHGEGRFEKNSNSVELEGKIAVKYAAVYCAQNDDDEGILPYPFNPNGSVLNIAGLCSPCGRHLALMPHTERSYKRYQWPIDPIRWGEFSPWVTMFSDAYSWCLKANPEEGS
eukprot:snap_masked-scaffold_2-processed-gene-8.7-mRNA-1 protein AED:0.02 eAED:0.02 QI:0/0/0/1/1/1/3/0/1303